MAHPPIATLPLRRLKRHLAAPLAASLLMVACGGGAPDSAGLSERASALAPSGGAASPADSHAEALSAVGPNGEAAALEPEMVQDIGTAIVTRFADRARDRHARESVFHIYDHYLPWYWEQRTAVIEITDKVAKGGTEIIFNVYPGKDLSAPEFRAFFYGLTTPGQYFGNYSMTRVGTLPYHYTVTLTYNEKERRGIRIGDRMEIEVSQFLQAPTHGRTNYYGTAVLYVVGSGGIVPWQGVGALLDSFPLPEVAWSGGRNITLPYQYSNEPLERFKGIPGQTSEASIQEFMLGRRLHHTDFATGKHSEWPDENPVYTEQVGKLGPAFYEPSCVACHVNNGRAIPPTVGVTITNAVTKVGTPTGAADPLLGSSLQPLRTTGVPEGGVKLASYTLINGRYGDGTAYQLRRPVYAFTGPVPTNFSVRNTPPLIGMGLLESVTDASIKAMADPNDLNGDGISGRVQMVRDPETNVLRVGRFGWKAAKATVLHQIASALQSDMGVTNSVFPNPDCGSSQTGCAAAAVKVDRTELDHWTRYISLLGVAARRNLADADAIRGEALFKSANCGACHMPTLTTGSQTRFAELRSQTFHPYTDLLVHNMGNGLAATLREGAAFGNEWRTAPLWSIGLAPGAAGGAEAYLHDGRARTLSEAILWHGGEGFASREVFRNLSAADRAALLKFLQSI